MTVKVGCANASNTNIKKIIIKILQWYDIEKWNILIKLILAYGSSKFVTNVNYVFINVTKLRKLKKFFG